MIRKVLPHTQRERNYNYSWVFKRKHNKKHNSWVKRIQELVFFLTFCSLRDWQKTFKMLSNYGKIGQVVLQLYSVIMQLLVSTSCQLLHQSNVTHSTAYTSGRELAGNDKWWSSNKMTTLYNPSGLPPINPTHHPYVEVSWIRTLLCPGSHGRR